MPTTSRVERAEQQFRQLCCLALDARLILPSLFRALYPVLPFGSCLSMWLGADGPLDVYFNLPEVGQYLPLYAQRYFRSAESGVWATTDEAARTECGPQLLEQVLRIAPAAYFRHPIYNEIFRPSNVHTFIRLLVRDGGRPFATFTIGRGAHDHAFTRDDALVLQRLQPFITHALMQRVHPLPAGVDADGDDVDAESALLVVDERGRLQEQSAAATRLLSLSQGSALAPAVLHEGLLRTLLALNGVDRTGDGVAAPVWRTRNAWGLFTARAYRLAPELPTRTGIHLVRQVPRRLRLLDGLHRLALPLRQERVGLLLALGRSEEQAARELGLSRNTVVYHRRQIYNRLGVDSRSGLLARLGAAG